MWLKIRDMQIKHFLADSSPYMQVLKIIYKKLNKNKYYKLFW
jgi:hypothetical protein